MAVLTEEQTMLRDGAKDWTAARAPVSALRKLRDGGGDAGFDPTVWKEMGELGWAGVVVSEDHGGSAFGYAGLGLVLEETGRTLVASPLLSTGLIGAAALSLGGSEAQKAAWLPKIASGETVVALALEETAHHAPARTALKGGHVVGNGFTLDGKKTFVLDGMEADVLIVAARTSGAPGDEAGITLLLVAADTAGVTRRRLATIDSRGAAEIAFSGVHVGEDAVLGEVDGGFALLDRLLDRARAGAAAEMLGTAAQAFETTLEYLKTRNQFGQLIGGFQAMQHRAAKMFTDLETTRSAVEAALEAIDRADASGSDAEVAAACSLAKALAGETLHKVSNEMVQMHGGIGMTDAHDSGLYLKRARVIEAAYGGAAFHRDRYARLMGF